MRACRLPSAPRSRLAYAALGCLLLLSATLLLHGYLFCLPFSQFAYPLELDFHRLVTELEASPDGRLPWVSPVNPAPFPVLHANPARCSGQASPHLLMLIKSALPNRRYRAALRATWASAESTLRYSFRYAFVLGGTRNASAQAAVDTEQRQFGDLIQQDFIDAYFNNTYKMMFAIDWATTVCPRARYVLFADDDYYVSLPNLRHLTQSLSEDPGTSDYLVMGHVFSAPLPKRSLFNKWYTPLAEYPYAFWPPYPTGGAFLVSGRLCRQLSLIQPYVKYLRFDDVFLGILLWKLGVRPIHNSLFHFGYVPRPLTRSVYSGYVAVHLDKDLEALAEIWRVMGLAKVVVRK